MATVALFVVTCLVVTQQYVLGFTADYADALSKSILFYEGMRSGKLPTNQRLTWRGDSGLADGSDVKVDLVGGYFDAGNNEKFGLPMAFAVTMLSWSVVEAGSMMGPELAHAHNAIKWGSDYLLKAYRSPSELWVQVGNANAAHTCWERPEDMDTPRTAYKVDAQSPGSEVAGETGAALAAASLAFQTADPAYAARLLAAAEGVCNFAKSYPGSYSDTLGSVVTSFYRSYSGFKDELLWCSAWLYRASRNQKHLDYIIATGNDLGGTTSTYNALTWDNKLAGSQVLLSRIALSGKAGLAAYKARADDVFCSLLPGNPRSSATFTPGGLLYLEAASNMQYVTSTAFLAFVYGKYLGEASQTMSCGGVQVSPSALVQFAKGQINYILGDNPQSMSYMVGYGTKYPQFVHHRASSLPSVGEHPQQIECGQGFQWLQSSKPNPNTLVGAVVGGPDKSDFYTNDRARYDQTEPTVYINAPLVGALAFLS